MHGLPRTARFAIPALVLLSSGGVDAAMIDYTVTVNGANGVLGSTAFSNQTVTFALHGNTDNIGYTGGTTFPEYFLGIPSATVTVGNTTVAITDATSIASFPTPSSVDNFFVGIDIFFTPAVVGNTTLLFVGSPTAFAGYALANPLTATGNFGATFTSTPTKVVDTAGGGLYFTSIPSQASFTASAGAVPEPASLALVATGLAVTAMARSFRRRAQAREADRMAELCHA